MTIKKMLLLIGAAVAVAAFTVPGTASEFQIKDHGKSVEDKEFEATGKVKFSAAGSGFECTLHERITVNGTTARVTKSEYTASTCVPFGFAYNECKVTSVTATSTPWTIAVDETGLTFSEDLDFVFAGEKCPLSESETVAKTTQYPIDINKKTAKLGAGLEIETTTTCKDKKAGEFSEIVSGNLEIVGADSETYEIA